MKYLWIVLLVMAFALMATPAAALWKIVWQDRKIPKTHNDYSTLYWGKRMIPITASLLTIGAALCALGVRWCLK